MLYMSQRLRMTYKQSKETRRASLLISMAGQEHCSFFQPDQLRLVREALLTHFGWLITWDRFRSIQSDRCLRLLIVNGILNTKQRRLSTRTRHYSLALSPNLPTGYTTFAVLNIDNGLEREMSQPPPLMMHRSPWGASSQLNGAL